MAKSQNSKTQSLLIPRLKALIIDVFMIYTPILYLMTYIILGSKEALWQNQEAIFLCVLLYGAIDSTFCALSMQTPGMKAQGLFLCRKNQQKVSFFLSLTRFFVWLLSIGLVFGLIFPFLRKDRETFHDLLCQTKIFGTLKSI